MVRGVHVVPLQEASLASGVGFADTSMWRCPHVDVGAQEEIARSLPLAV